MHLSFFNSVLRLIPQNRSSAFFSDNMHLFSSYVFPNVWALYVKVKKVSPISCDFYLVSAKIRNFFGHLDLHVILRHLDLSKWSFLVNSAKKILESSMLFVRSGDCTLPHTFFACPFTGLLKVVATERMQEFLFALSTCLAFFGGQWCVAHQRPIQFLPRISPWIFFFNFIFCTDAKKRARAAAHMGTRFFPLFLRWTEALQKDLLHACTSYSWSDMGWLF